MCFIPSLALPGGLNVPLFLDAPNPEELRLWELRGDILESIEMNLGEGRTLGNNAHHKQDTFAVQQKPSIIADNQDR